MDDAKFVVGIHTDIFFGSPYNLADRDFYFNGGKKQPDCGLTLCDHLEAPLMLTPYMDRCRMVAYRCETYESFRGEIVGLKNFLTFFKTLIN